jgi:hypothetical protein
MSFQWIIDSAETLSIDKKQMIGQSQTRSGIVRATSRGPLPAVITARFPDGPRWVDIRTDVLAAQALDRYQTATIAIPFTRFPWYYGNVQPAQNESYLVLCTEFPQWTLFGQGQVRWSGAFVFQEVKT